MRSCIIAWNHRTAIAIAVPALPTAILRTPLRAAVLVMRRLGLNAAVTVHVDIVAAAAVTAVIDFDTYDSV